MFNGGTRKRMLAAAIGGCSTTGLSVEGSRQTNNQRSKILEQSSLRPKPNTSPSMPHNTAAAAAVAAVAGRATLAAARAACAAACVAQASSSSSGIDGSDSERYGGIYEGAHREQRNKVGILCIAIFSPIAHINNASLWYSSLKPL